MDCLLETLAEIATLAAAYEHECSVQVRAACHAQDGIQPTCAARLSVQWPLLRTERMANTAGSLVKLAQMIDTCEMTGLVASFCHQGWLTWF